MFVNNRYARFIFQLLKSLLTIPLNLFGYLVPKSNEVWIFGHTHGYIDNPKYLYEYLLINKVEGIRAVWISKKKSDNSIAGESYYYLSVKGLYIQYRAAVACIATGSSDVASFTLARTKIVQLWHGIPIKKLLLDSPETSPFPRGWNIANQVFYRLLRVNLRKYSLLIAVNENNQACLSQAFGLPLDKVKITGLPRHDIILSGINNRLNNKILYAPTWHSSIEEARKRLDEVLSDDLMDYCIKQNIVIDISIHPINAQLKNQLQTNNIFRIFDKMDINEALSQYDILITDYSSIALDFSILNRPVIFCCGEMSQYRKERGIYDFFWEILNKNNISAEHLVENIEKIKKSNVGNYNFYGLSPDCNARAHIINEVKRIL